MLLAGLLQAMLLVGCTDSHEPNARSDAGDDPIEDARMTAGNGSEANGGSGASGGGGGTGGEGGTGGSGATGGGSGEGGESGQSGAGGSGANGGAGGVGGQSGTGGGSGQGGTGGVSPPRDAGTRTDAETPDTGIVEELFTCEQVEAAYRDLLTAFADCTGASECHILLGQCGVGLGGCHEAVNNGLAQERLDALGLQYGNLGCTGSVCRCEPPPQVDCIRGQCRPAAERGCPERIREVACDATPPDCPEGFFPGSDGACWTGECLHCVNGCQSDDECVGVTYCGCGYHEGCGWAETVFRLDSETDPCIVDIADSDSCPDTCPISCPPVCEDDPNDRCCAWCDPPDGARCENGICVEILTHMCM